VPPPLGWPPGATAPPRTPHPLPLQPIQRSTFLAIACVLCPQYKFTWFACVMLNRNSVYVISLNTLRLIKVCLSLLVFPLCFVNVLLTHFPQGTLPISASKQHMMCRPIGSDRRENYDEETVLNITFENDYESLQVGQSHGLLFGQSRHLYMM